MTTDHPTEQTGHVTNLIRLAALLLPVLLAVYLLITSTTQLSDTLWQYDAKRMLQLYLLPLMFLWALLIPSLRQAFSDQVSRIPRWMMLSWIVSFTTSTTSIYKGSPCVREKQC